MNTQSVSPSLSLIPVFSHPKNISSPLQCFTHREEESLYQEALLATPLRQFYKLLTPAWLYQSECGR